MEFSEKLEAFYKEHGRGHLPWRKTKDPYKILVSEMMLQQTQVERVIPKYHEFLHAFPTIKVLAAATFPEVLSHWSGLGYNRRAKFLHEAAKATVRDFKSTLPYCVEKLMLLPGVGPYTACAVAAFAHNQPVVFIETNIRTVFTWEYLMEREEVYDAELMPLIEKELRQSKLPPHDFYAALMDYGAFLKRSGVRINSKSRGYVKQSPFRGSARQLRGAILRELLVKPMDIGELHIKSNRTLKEIEHELAKLAKEGLVQKQRNKFQLAK